MKHNLIYAMNELIDSGHLMCRENYSFRSMPFFYYLEPHRAGIKFPKYWGKDPHEGDVYTWIPPRSNTPDEFDDEFEKITSYCRDHGLPLHNPVAFFTKVLEQEQALCRDEESRNKLIDILLIALAGGGFAFSTAFLVEQSIHVRECDLLRLNKGEYDRKMDLITYAIHAQLKGADYFYKSLSDMQHDIIKPLEEKRNLFSQWYSKVCKTLGQRQKPAVGSDDDMEFMSIEDFESLFQGYEIYCLMLQNSDSIKQTVDNLRQSCFAILKLHEFWKTRPLKESNIEEDAALQKKESWIRNFRDFVIDLIESEKLEGIRKIGVKDDLWLDHEFFDKLRRFPSLSKDDLKNYKLLDSSSLSEKLTRDERNALLQYRKHPMYQFLKEIHRELENEDIQHVAPYYIFQLLKTTAKPQTIIKGTFRFSETMISLNETVKMDESTGTQYLRYHKYLYEMLCCWWDRVTAEGAYEPHDKKLCDFLFARYSGTLSRTQFRVYASDPAYIKYKKRDLMGDVLFHIDETFSSHFEIFPQFTLARVAPYDYLTFSVESAMQQEADRKVMKAIRQLIKSDQKIVEEYKNLAFLNANGIGISAPERSWYFDMARWFQNIIERDPGISTYVEGKEDAYVPQLDMSVKELKENIDFLPEYEPFAEDFLPNLARVEIAIQEECFKYIREEMIPKVASLYKRILFDVTITSVPSQGEIPTKREESIPPH